MNKGQIKISKHLRKNVSRENTTCKGQTLIEKKVYNNESKNYGGRM